jgi:hypothetical protein
MTFLAQHVEVQLAAADAILSDAGRTLRLAAELPPGRVSAHLDCAALAATAAAALTTAARHLYEARRLGELAETASPTPRETLE